MAQDRIKLCEEALRALGKVHSSLSAVQEECPQCGTHRYTEWGEARAKRQIAGAMSRITTAKIALEEVSSE